MEEFEFLKTMSMMRQSGGNEIAGAYREKQMGMEGVEIKLHSFLTLEPDGDEKSAISPGWLTPEETTPYYHYLNNV